jgi:hypothetical protein
MQETQKAPACIFPFSDEETPEIQPDQCFNQSRKRAGLRCSRKTTDPVYKAMEILPLGRSCSLIQQTG